MVGLCLTEFPRESSKSFVKVANATSEWESNLWRHGYAFV